MMRLLAVVILLDGLLELKKKFSSAVLLKREIWSYKHHHRFQVFCSFIVQGFDETRVQFLHLKYHYLHWTSITDNEKHILKKGLYLHFCKGKLCLISAHARSLDTLLPVQPCWTRGDGQCLCMGWGLVWGGLCFFSFSKWWARFPSALCLPFTASGMRSGHKV